VFETGNSNFKPSGINFWFCLCTTCTFSLVCCHVSTPTSTTPTTLCLSVCLSVSLSLPPPLPLFRAHTHTHTHTHTNTNKKFENNKRIEKSSSMRFLRHQKDNKPHGAEKCLVTDGRSAGKDVFRILRETILSLPCSLAPVTGLVRIQLTASHALSLAAAIGIFWFQFW